MRTITDIPDLQETGAKVELPEVKVGQLVNDYLAALAKAEAAETALGSLKPKLVALGLTTVIAHNCANPVEKHIKSARLVGVANEEKHEVAPVLLAVAVDKDPKIDVKKAELDFASVMTTEGKKANVNNYTRYQIVADFDSACFHDDKGNVDSERMDEIMAAFEATSKRLGIGCPVTLSKKLVPTPSWWTGRFSKFAPATLLTLCTQTIIQQVQLKRAAAK